MPIHTRLILLLIALLMSFPGWTQADNNTVYIFSAPPRETMQVGKDKYDPVARYLSMIIGKKVVYEHPGNWGVYRSRMIK
ncbi:MAG TPA: hypothetical protein ENG78_05330, partial [Acidiferrobacteraceae bacterium]|nr:hypothetical protein [Acidiferrobacteraceae bacterium]HEX20223.1 hypothetical protein [Acidiferrobacteraceae bacterium]